MVKIVTSVGRLGAAPSTLLHGQAPLLFSRRNRVNETDVLQLRACEWWKQREPRGEVGVEWAEVESLGRVRSSKEEHGWRAIRGKSSEEEVRDRK